MRVMKYLFVCSSRLVEERGGRGEGIGVQHCLEQTVSGQCNGDQT